MTDIAERPSPADALDPISLEVLRSRLAAIADGTFGLMKRPADGGRGLDGVARRSDSYYNPATEQLEAK